MLNSDPHLIIMAIDPGAKRAGVAVWARGALQSTEEMVNMESKPGGALSWLSVAMDLDPKARLLVVTEYPTAGTPGGPQVRQAANILVARLKNLYPKRMRVAKVVPQTWQSRVTKGMPQGDPKARSLARATFDYTLDATYLKGHQDVADALNILTYARGFESWEGAKP